MSAGHRTGERRHGATLTDHDCDLIAALVEEGMSLSVVAHKFEISKGHAHRIARGTRTGRGYVSSSRQLELMLRPDVQVHDRDR